MLIRVAQCIHYISAAYNYLKVASTNWPFWFFNLLFSLCHSPSCGHFVSEVAGLVCDVCGCW